MCAAWAPWSSLRIDEANREQIEAVSARSERARYCAAATSTRYNSATSGIITARQRAAASDRIARNRRACGAQAAADARTALRERLLEERYQEFVRHYAELRAARGW